MTKSTLQTVPYTTEDKVSTIYRNWREGFVAPLLIGSLVFGLFALIPAVIASKTNLVSILFIIFYILVGLIAFIPFTYAIRMGTFHLIIYSLGVIELAVQGILGDGLFFFLALVIFTTMMFSPRAGILATSINIITMLVFGWFMLTGNLRPVNSAAPPAAIQDWMSAAALMVLFSAVIILGFQRLEGQITDVQKQVGTTLSRLTDDRNNLELMVQERTSQLKKVNDIGRIVTSILDPDELISGAVFLIGNEFNCYYTAIYFIDPTGQWAELKDATGDAGKVLRENKHRVDLGGKSAIATTLRTKQPYLAIDAGHDPARFDNPLLPYTRSQIILPLMVGDRVMGVLEMHSTKESAFTNQDVDTFSNMANQIAIAAENSRLFKDAQQSLKELRSTQRLYLEGSWSSLMSEKTLEYELGDEESTDNEIEIPLALRDQIIGQIKMATDEEWTPEQRNLIESIASQAALALENARLVEESQSIAIREKLANEIISKVWSTTNLDSILQTTVRELGRALDASQVDIEVRMGEKNE